MCNLHASGDVSGVLLGLTEMQKNSGKTVWSLEMRLPESGDGYEFQETASHYKAQLFVCCLSNVFFFPGQEGPGTKQLIALQPFTQHGTDAGGKKGILNTVCLAHPVPAKFIPYILILSLTAVSCHFSA